jgi:drug/metabolite transporter (DMT)-like permease
MSESGARQALTADVVLVLITALWGATFVVVKDAIASADPFSFIALRFSLGAAIAAAVARSRLLHRPSLQGGAVLAAFLFTGFALQTWGLVHTTPARSAFITGLSVVFVPFVSAALSKRWPPTSTLFGIALAVGGLYLLTGVGTDAGQATAGLWLGDGLTFGCALAFAVHITLTERYARQALVSTLVATQLFGTALLGAMAAALVGPRVTLSPGFISAVLFCGIFASAIAILLQTWAQKRTSAVHAALVFSMEPVFAAGYSVLLGREHLGPLEWLGGGLILAGVLAGELGPLLLARRATLG